jgi:hypothetical protein
MRPTPLTNTNPQNIPTAKTKMKTIVKILSTSAAALLITATASFAAPVQVNVDSSFEGLATPMQNPLAAGVIQVGWLTPGTTESTITSLFDVGNLAGIDSLFNTVGTITFSLGSPNTFGTGLVFDTLNLTDNVTDPTGFTAYKDATTGAAGKGIFLWYRDTASLGSTTLMGFVDTATPFPTANDTNGFSDFGANVATDSFTITNANAWVGSLNAVINGSGIDLNGGSPQDGTGLNGGTTVYQLATVVPEPTTASLAFLGMASLVGFVRRRRA